MQTTTVNDKKIGLRLNSKSEQVPGDSEGVGQGVAPNAKRRWPPPHSPSPSMTNTADIITDVITAALRSSQFKRAPRQHAHAAMLPRLKSMSDQRGVVKEVSVRDDGKCTRRGILPEAAPASHSRTHRSLK